MTGNSTEQTASKRSKSRLKWTESMNTKLLDCKRKAKEMVQSDDPPRKADGKKQGYMDIMKHLWDSGEFADSDISKQNLRDQASRLEKSLGSTGSTIREELNIERVLLQTNIDNQEANNENPENIYCEIDNNTERTRNLHITLSEIPEGIELSTDVKNIIQSARLVFASVAADPGDFTNRLIDSRTKKRPTKQDIININAAIEQMMRNDVNTGTDPTQNPFVFLWLANCVVYSVVVAFLVIKKWKKLNSSVKINKRNPEEKEKEIYEAQVAEIRKNISIAVAEIDRLRANRSLTKRAKKNRAKLQKSCKNLSVATLVNFVEMEKSKLRKLKRVFWRRKKLESARKLNEKFYADPGSVYDSFGKMLESQANVNNPKYDEAIQNTQSSTNKFTSINEAISFWKGLWEREGNGNTNAEWIADIREAFEEAVPEVPTTGWNLEAEHVTNIINRKKNWSAPGPDLIANFWWKKATCLHKEIAASFKATSQLTDLEFPSWFSEGKTTLIPKPGVFSSDNHRPITCLNNLYKWFTSCLLVQANKHIEGYGLMQREQRGARENCSGTVDNLLIDQMVCVDAQRGRRNVSMAWIDVAKAYDSVDHRWLSEMFTLHRFPPWFGKVMDKLSLSWNTRIVAQTTQGKEISATIRFNIGLPQGDALCPMLFTLCLNPIAWKVRASEGYRLTKPISTKITHLLYIDDMKLFAASENKLKRVMTVVKSGMENTGLKWNEKKCSVMHVKKGQFDQDKGDMKIDDLKPIKNLDRDSSYKFLGVLENTKQDGKQVLEVAAKTYLQRLSIIWSSPLSDHAKTLASNQYALPVITYLMWTQIWPIAELQQLDREARKIIVENGGNHPKGSTAILYMSRKKGGRGLKSVESEYKNIKIKAAMKLYSNADPTMAAVRSFEELAVHKGRHSIIKEAKKFASELELDLQLNFPNPVVIVDGKDLEAKKTKQVVNKARQQQIQSTVSQERWQGKLIKARWEDESIHLDKCFAWLSAWKNAPTHTIAGIQELYQQLLPTKVYYSRRIRSEVVDELCRLCGKSTESVQHVLSGCSALAQSKYLQRHNNALKIIFFEVLRSLDLITKIEPWYSPALPKPFYENEHATAYWDVPLYADTTHVKANRIDATIIDHTTKQVKVIEMSCPWVENREIKDAEKTAKYSQLRLELKHRYAEYKITQYNIIVDVLGCCSKDVENNIKELVGENQELIIRQVQKSVLTSSLNIARAFKLCC